MGDFLGSIWWMLVSLGILITFHEFGHFWVARRCGVKVLRFSVGFGKPLWSRCGKDGTEFAIAAIPLGGYVKMLDEREGPVADADLSRAFNRKNVWQRIAIVAAGPIANLLLCVALLWVMFLIGRQDYAPVVGRVAGIAADAGLQSGDRILRVGDRDVATWNQAAMVMTLSALDGHDVALHVRNASGQQVERTLPLSRLPTGFDEGQVALQAGIVWQFQRSPPVITTIQAGSAAEGVLQLGDRILAIDGQRIGFGDEVAPAVQVLGARGGEAMIDIERDGERLALPIEPRRNIDPKAANQWLLGIGTAPKAMPAYDAVEKFGPLPAASMALRQTGQLFSDSLGMIRRMITGRASVENISGPITIARVANDSAKRGTDWFLYFLALISLSLAIINLMPIPILDGGHLLYYLIELVKGSPLSDRAAIAGQYVGLALLAGLMGLAFYNDILRLPLG